MATKNYIDYKNYSPSDCYESIIRRNEESAEQLYYLLKTRLSMVLSNLYRQYGVGLQDEFDDTIDDFFLYLHDGNTSCKRPFALLEAVQEKRAFFSWLIGAYRIFLLNKQRNTFNIPVVRGGTVAHRVMVEESFDDSMTRILSNAIAYADQQLNTRNRFVFYRMILSFLDHRSAIPQEVMARAIGMHPVTYRVCTKRQKDRLLTYIIEQEKGVFLQLDDEHLLMRDRIMHHFDQLYALLAERYGQTVADLPQSGKVEAVRKEYSRGKEQLMHETQPVYGFSDAVSIIHRLKEQGVGGD